MDSVLRKFGIRKGEPRESEARQKLQKELFAYHTCTDHGFPNKPSSLAYDPKLRLLAIGTKNGEVKVVGVPGVEFSGHHQEDVSVTQLLFLPGQARLITLCSDNSLHLWEINPNPEESGTAVLEEARSFSMEASKLKTITACCLTSSADQLLLGTEGGNVHVLNVYSFQLTDQIIYQDTVIQNVPDDFKVNPGAVECIVQHPTQENKFLLGYNRGLIVLWNNHDNNSEQTYNASQQLESLSWHRDGTQFMSAHADGSYIVWSTADCTKPKEHATTPYGPFPCKAINKIQWKTAKADPLIIFSGGMPRASYGDRHSVSVMQGQDHVVFDFTSRVVDYVTLNSTDELADYDKTDYDDPHTLVVLAEEEIVAVDLQSDGWQTFRPPYLASLHSSAITCAQHVTNVPEALWGKIMDAGDQQQSNSSSRDWPITGGLNNQQAFGSRDLLLTGHEDGSVRFWDASSTSMRMVYRLNSSSVFGTESAADQTSPEEEEWPPFRKVGTFDPYSDDPRLGIQKIAMCPLSETLLLGGTAGQVVVLQFEREDREQEVRVESMNLVSDRDNFVWKGHEALPVRGGDIKFTAGFQPVCVVQLQPPAAVTAMALQSEWQLLAVGTAHGFGVFDYVQKKEVTTKCTLNPADLTGTGDSAMSRRKSFKKSLRESFRRLRRRRSEKRKRASEQAQQQESGKLEEQKTETAKTEGEGQKSEASASTEPAGATAATPTKSTEAHQVASESPKPVERQVESRTHAADDMASMVRVLYFTDSFLLNNQNHTPTLWAGTNHGTVFIFQITMPASDKRDSDAVTCVLGKEIHLKHRAPVLAVCVIDRNAQPLPGPLELQHERAKAPDMTGNHHVVICSEEQFKIFTLPSLKPNNKYKLTAHEGSKVRKLGFVNFRSKSDERYSENDLAILTNMGDVQVFTLPQLRRQIKAQCVRKDNVSGIVSGVFTQNGEGFFLNSPSEFVRFSLSARFITKPSCAVDLEDDVRPPLESMAALDEAPTEEGAAESTEAAAPTETTGGATETQAEEQTPESGEGDKKDESAAEKSAADDSAVASALGDLSMNETVDSVRVHLSEGATVTTSSQVVRTVVKRTTISETTSGGETVTHQTTTVEHSGSGDIPESVLAAVATATGETVTVSSESGAGDSAAAAADSEATVTNLDDDAKLTTKGSEEVTEPATSPLEELRILEEGDEDKGGETMEMGKVTIVKETTITTQSLPSTSPVEITTATETVTTETVTDVPVGATSDEIVDQTEAAESASKAAPAESSTNEAAESTSPPVVGDAGAADSTGNVDATDGQQGAAVEGTDCVSDQPLPEVPANQAESQVQAGVVTADSPGTDSQTTSITSS